MVDLEQDFRPEMHQRFLMQFFGDLPAYFAHLEPSRVVLNYFSTAGLDALGKIDSLSAQKRKSTINWLYSLLVNNSIDLVSGFQATGILNTVANRGQNTAYKWGHIANTYAALCTLIILGDDLSGVDRQSIIESLRTLQLPNGSFKAAVEGTEDDMRFVFCAAAVSYILDDWSGVNLDTMVQFILDSISYEGGIGQSPGLEAHCGSTFCAVAALKLSNNLHKLSKAQFKRLRMWLLNRLSGGFTGRPNKPFDTCYSMWTGGALKILNAYKFLDTCDCEKYILAAQDKYGGISKTMNSIPDPMHTYFGIAGLSLMGVHNLSPIFCDLVITERAHQHLKKLHELWRL